MKEKKYIYNDNQIKYIFEENDSDVLMIIFSGLPRKGVSARYNYMSTLEPFKVNKLFLLDDFGYDNRGNFYLGHDKKFETMDLVRNIISEKRKKINPRKTIYCGSSKGGYAALMYGLEDPSSRIIVGSLQYKLGNYLTHKDTDDERMKSIMGEDYTLNDVEFLNQFLYRQLKNNFSNNSIFLHYSDIEYTYERDTQYLIKDLNSLHIPFESDVQHYEYHKDLSIYFPTFLKETVSLILSER